MLAVAAGTSHMSDIEVAIAAVREGAEVVRRRFGTQMERIDKGAGDFATSADIAAEAAMLAVLRRQRPSDAIVGEESGRSGATAASRLWLIDPLCGTLNYAARMRVVAVNAALVTARRALAAAVADPFAGEVFWASGDGACVRAGGRDAPLAPSASSRLVDLNLDPPFPNAPRFRAATLAADSDFSARFKPRVVSSSLALTWVATGRRAAYVTDGDIRDSVHFAAGLAVCEAAGCVISDLHGGAWDEGARGLIVAAHPDTHATLVRLVRKQRG
jgi:myo-inositol-1(or 4)-monophosphatase